MLHMLDNLDTLIIGDIVAGRGTYLLEFINKGADPKNIYYNDSDPATVSQFRKTNSQYNVGIPDVNITCCDALKYKETYPMRKFDVGIGNPPFNSSNVKTANGTGGNVTLYKSISDAYPIKDGGIKALITPKGMTRFFDSDDGFKTVYVNYMTEKDYWKYNTCYWVQKKVDGKNPDLEIADKVLNKILTIKGNDKWWELNGEVNKNMLKYKGEDAVKAIVDIPNAKRKEKYDKVDPSYGKILYGPKFCATLLENKHSYFVTDQPLCSKFTGAVSTATVDEAEKIKLFVENSDLLAAVHSRAKFKGLFWTMRHIKSFDPNQIVTGKEIPVEWNLSKEDLEYLGV